MSALQTPPASSASESQRHDRPLVILAIVIFAALSLAASLSSRGFLEADGCTHYMYARFAFAEPHYLVNVWGRPLVTALYAVPATLAGRFGVRTTSLLLAIGCALVARAIASDLGDRRPMLALLFTLGQPLVFLHSFSELTELPFALLLGLAFLMYVRRRWLAMTIIVGILPLCRPEGFGFVVLAVFALLAHRRARLLLLLPVALLAWDFAGWMLYGRPTYPGLAEHLPRALQWFTWLGHNWPYAEKSAYASGSILHFVMLMPAVTSPLVFPATCLGVVRSFSDRPLEALRDHRTRCRWLSALLPLSILTGHSLLYWTGRMASSGELRYMLVVAPFWGILSARGWAWFFRGWGVRKLPWFAVLACIAPLLVNRHYQVLPLEYGADWAEAADAAQWLRTTPLRSEYPYLLVAHPAIDYFLGISMTDRTRSREWRKSTVAAAPPGTMLVWDNVYGVYNADTERSVTLNDILAAGWIPRPTPAVTNATRDAPPTWQLFLSPKTIDGRPTPRPRHSLLPQP